MPKIRARTWTHFDGKRDRRGAPGGHGGGQRLQKEQGGGREMGPSPRSQLVFLLCFFSPCPKSPLYLDPGSQRVFVFPLPSLHVENPLKLLSNKQWLGVPTNRFCFCSSSFFAMPNISWYWPTSSGWGCWVWFCVLRSLWNGFEQAPKGSSLFLAVQEPPKCSANSM